MVDLKRQERLQPSLLDRLLDDDPGNPAESVDKRVLSLSQLRASVLRDLAWLFNTIAPLNSDGEAQTAAGSSVVNFGLPPLAGHSASSVDVQAVEQLLAKAIANFEPRIVRSSLRVRARHNAEDMSHNSLSFEIEGDLWAHPMPLRLLLTTELDLETGHVQVLPADASRRRR
ncbi:type VI secretion system baseplate subunit TssE [Phytopseudomonas dryadis]|uniref:Type VI secretion system baseplate subunit TssE n=1 Tax=Phytopseudomonas dryadis TaxID=2487520 RepID=A0A4Q9R841_9GAMM|nr:MULTISPECIES: type VI secretion system baseplate subunit TssE [Pseudomonas]TBU96088.1 type VI secretion system baseplate subunit TssE [Pseudomonas dryadis]TBV01093.1 type VI secretion system baseplate subunit TssE [Pseudomonas dryadis]TBV13803.1 type VI secretion system baseplate subunit TssE [Pseudomonas sp. FRB 230]